MEEILAMGDRAGELLLSLESIFAMYPKVTVGAADEKRCRNGVAPRIQGAPEGRFRLSSETGAFLALGEKDADGGRIVKSFYEV